jgi:GT2 family glycosyltransferase
VEGSNDTPGPSAPEPGSEWMVRRGRQVPDRPDVTVCVLVLDRTDLVEGCLDSIATTTSLATEVIVVANGTPEALLSTLAARQDIVLLRSSVNLGFGGGNNLAARFAGGEYLVFVNDDSLLAPGCVDRLVERAATDPAIGAVGSRIVSADGTLQEAGAVVWRDGSATHVGRGLAADAPVYQAGRDVDYCSANGLLVRRTVWESVGGFDEHYFPAYYEDVDLCLRVRDHGCRVVYEPAARLVHLESQSTSDRFKAFLLERHRQRLAAAWSDELATHEPPPTTDKPAAVQRAIRRDHDRPSSSGRGRRAVPVVGRPEGATRADGERWAVEAALAVKDEYIDSLHRQLEVLQADIDHHHRWKGRGRRVAREVASRLPAGARKRLQAAVRR